MPLKGENASSAGDRCAAALTANVAQGRAETITKIRRTREVSMMDVLMIGIALGLFVLAVTYAHAIGEK